MHSVDRRYPNTISGHDQWISTRPHGGPQDLSRQPDKPRKKWGL